MIGKHEVVVQNNRVQYKFAVRRNLTILRGDSATGKSSTFFSWERFFTKYLTDKTKDTYLHYGKRELNPVYLQDHEKAAIMKGFPE